MAQIGNDPVSDNPDRAMPSVVEGQDPTRHAKVPGVMDIDKNIVHPMTSIDKDQSKFPSFVAEVMTQGGGE